MYEWVSFFFFSSCKWENLFASIPLVEFFDRGSFGVWQNRVCGKTLVGKS